MENLAKLPEFIRGPGAHLIEITSAYQGLITDLPELRQTVFKLSQGAGPLKTLHARYQTVYGIPLAFAIILNTILRSFGVDNISLFEESVTLVDEIITLAEDASQYRPLGSSAMPLFLVAAWAGTNEVSKRAKIEEILTEYQFDFAIARWMETAAWLEFKLKNECLIDPTLVGGDLEKPAGTPCCTM